MCLFRGRANILIFIAFVSVLGVSNECFAEETKLAAHLLLSTGESVHLTDVTSSRTIPLSLGKFKLDVQYSLIRSLEILVDSPSKKHSVQSGVKLIFDNEKQLSAEVRNYGEDIEGNWELGYRTVPWKAIKEVTFHPSSKHREEIFETIGEITDIDGHKVPFVLLRHEGLKGSLMHMLFRDSLRIVDSNWWQEYFPLPFGGGFIFLDVGEIKAILKNDSDTLQVNRRGQKAIRSFYEKEVFQRPWEEIRGRSGIGEFSIKWEHIQSIKFSSWKDRPESTKPGTGEKRVEPISGFVIDRWSRSHKVKDMLFYYNEISLTSHWRLGRIEHDLPIRLPDGGRLTIAFKNLASCSFKTGYPNIRLETKTRKLITGKFIGSVQGEDGILGLTTIADSRYWGYFPMDYIKEMKFD